MNKKITIFGAGLVGSLLATLLQKKGHQVSIYERRSDMRHLNISAGKSINLAMSLRGWDALESAGLKSEIEQLAIPMYGRQIHHLDGSLTFQPYGKNNEAIFSVSRGELNKQLMTSAEKEGVKIYFNQKIIDVNLQQNSFSVVDEQNQIHTNHSEILIGADGAFSALRNAYMKRERFNYHQFYIPHGYKELCIPAGEDGTFLMEKNALHIWPRKNFMLIALPNTDATFTCTLFLPFEGGISFDELKTDTQILHFFESYFPDALQMIPELLEQFKTNPVSSLVTVKCSPWVYEDKSMLIGDAAHAIVPFYGQGMNAGFEDCTQFMQLLEEYPNNWNHLFVAYEKNRKVNGDAVADLALQNFIEMRDLVADPKFITRKSIEKQLGKLFPQQFNSVYEMVSFSHTPYHFALSCQKLQDKLLEKIQNVNIPFDELIQNENHLVRLREWINEYEYEIQKIQI